MIFDQFAVQQSEFDSPARRKFVLASRFER